MLPFNRPQITQAIAEMFGLKGRVQIAVTDYVNPGMEIARLWDSPYLRFGLTVAGNATASAVAAEFGYVMFAPGPNVALQIKTLIATNPTAGALRYLVRRSTAAQVATLGLSSSAFLNASAEDSSVPDAASRILVGTHTVNSSAIGRAIIALELPANSHTIVTLPDPGIILFGNDPNGIPALGFACTTLNVAAPEGSCFGREWPLPG